MSRLLLYLALATAAVPVPAPVPVPAELHVEIGEARLVAAGPATEHRWGRWQFPTLQLAPHGRLLLFVHVEPDSAASYGKQRRVSGCVETAQRLPDARSQPASAQPTAVVL